MNKDVNNTLPKIWVKGLLNDIVCSVKTGVGEYKGSKNYYSTGSINNHSSVPTGCYTFQSRPSRANRISQINDVFQARMKETSKALLIDEGLAGELFSTGFIQIRPYGDTYYSKLLYYFIQSNDFLRQRDELATGSTQEALTDRNSKKLLFPLPPLNEQKRITAKLDKIMPRIDALKERLDRIPQIIKRFRQAVLNAAVTGKLTEEWREKHPDGENARVLDADSSFDIPKCWKIAIIEDLVYSLKTDLRTGPFGTSLKKSEHQKNGVPIWGIESIGENGRFANFNKIFVTEEKAEELKSFSVAGGDIIISRSGTVGQLCILPENVPYGLISTNLMKISLNNEIIIPRYFCFLFDGSKEILRKLSELCSGSTRLFLTQKILKNLEFPLPPLEEQKEIVRQVDILFTLADKLETHYKKAKEKIDKLPQSVLAKTFRGELIPQDLNDEPASELLKRIIAEKEKRQAEIKKTKKR
ncbi:MAG: restriction endonuclease subunit S, partial [Deltaproteobacteria bacterium]|nr:restriction endonuclease subunit S [Deltaproteobacteria bacterium]